MAGRNDQSEEKRGIFLRLFIDGLVENLADFLGGHGFSTIPAYEGIKAVELAKKEKPGLVILDWAMPLGKGGAVLEMLGESEQTRHIPVVVFSGVTEPGMDEWSHKRGVKAVLKKGCEPEILLAVIQAVLSKAKAQG